MVSCRLVEVYYLWLGLESFGGEGGQGTQEDGFHQFSQIPAQCGQAKIALLGEKVISAQPAFKDPNAAVKQTGFLQGVQQGIKAAWADLITKGPKGLVHFVAVYRSQAGLVEKKNLHHPLNKIPMDLPINLHSRYMTYVG